MTPLLFIVGAMNLGIGVLSLRAGVLGLAAFHTGLALVSAVVAFAFAGRGSNHE